MLRWLIVIGFAVGLVKMGADCARAADDVRESLARELVADHEARLRPLERTANLAWWAANTTGADADFAAKEAAENALNAALSDASRFQKLKSLQAVRLDDSNLMRQIRVLYLQALDKQVDPELLKRIAAKANQIEKAFNVFRPTVSGRSLSDSDVRQILLKSDDSSERQAVWEASKAVGGAVANDLRELVLLRNEAARRLGFANYHVMQLELNEQSQAAVLQLFDELDRLTREPFALAKAEIDARLAARYRIPADALQAWHYQDPFFQEAQDVYDVSLDRPFADADILRICREFYAGIGLPVDDVLARSDVYEKPGKSPHAFCTDIDRAGDVRVLANITPSERWMSTMLHELGHAVYSSKFIPDQLPYVLRTESHILTTEGVAMMFERFASNAAWLREFGVSVDDSAAFNETGRKMRRDKLLIFSRWCQVMLRFEMELYDRPEQDLNQLWWDLVERYQLVRRPPGRQAPDYGSKIHIVSAPAYYHNYMMGQLFACQLHAAIVRDVLPAQRPVDAVYTREPRVGQFMRDKVFAHGRLLPWDVLTVQATGQPLNAQAFAAEFQQPR